MTVVLFMIGFVSILGQVVLLRELNVAFYGVELIYLIALSIWMFMTGAGAGIIRKDTIPSFMSVYILLLVFTVVIPLDIIYIRASRLIFSAVPGAFLPFHTQLTALTLAVLPPAFILGLSFRWAARIFIKRRGTLAKAYAVESIGGVFGGILSTIGITFGLSNLQMGLSCSACLLITMLSESIISHRFVKTGSPDNEPDVSSGQARGYVILPAVFLLLIVGVLMLLSTSFDRKMSRWNHPGLISSVDSPYGRISITQQDNQAVVFVNDMLAYETHSVSGEEFAHLSALQPVNSADFLLLGGAIEGIPGELLKHSPDKITCVELNELELSTVFKVIPSELTRSIYDKRVDLIIDDPRDYLARSRRKYDLILIAMPGPESAQANRYYTTDFFGICKNHLKDGGVVSLRLRSSENYLTPLMRQRSASIYASMNSVFSSTLVLPGSVNIMLASDSDLVSEPDRLIRRYAEREIEAKKMSAAYIEYLYTNDRFSTLNTSLRAESVHPNSDSNPVCFQLTARLWLSRFFPRMGQIRLESVIAGTIKKPVFVTVLILVMFFLMLGLRGKKHLASMILVGFMGFFGMVSESVLIMLYQLKRGVLYQDIGLLLTMFMAGLGMGAWMMHSTRRWVGHNSRRRQLTGMALIVAYGLQSIALSVWIWRGYPVDLTLVSMGLIMSGFLVSAVFSHVSLHRIRDRGGDAGHLYAVDLIGGACGALLGSLLLIPIAGLPGTIMGVGILAILCTLLV